MPLRRASLTKPAALYAAPPAERPREPRAPAQIVGTILANGERVPVRLNNLSRNGFGARSARPVPIGCDILVSLPVAGVVRAQVRWALGDLFGARFLEPIDVQALLDQD